MKIIHSPTRTAMVALMALAGVAGQADNGVTAARFLMQRNGGKARLAVLKDKVP